MALASDAVAAAVTPISGYLVFPAGVTLQEIMATSKDDSIPEPSQFFTVQLGNADGGARIDTRENTASLTGETKLPLTISQECMMMSLVYKMMSSYIGAVCNMHVCMYDNMYVCVYV